MKSLRYIFLLSLVALLLASCAGLPPVFPERAAQTTEQMPGAEPPATEAPAAAEQPAVQPAITDSGVVTATTPVTPTAEIAATAVVTETATAGTPASPTTEQVMGANPLVGVVWEWSALLRTKPAAQSVVPDPASYTIAFSGDGQVAIKADCNNATGTYTLTNDQLVITVGGVTRAACPPGSLGDLMLTSLGKVGSYLIDNGDLILRLGDSGDSMLFRNGGPSAVPAAPPAVATEAPAAAAPAATAVAPGETSAQATALMGPEWQWEQFIDVATGKNTLTVQNPEKYAVTFKDKGVAEMTADCNQAAGTYTVEGSSLTISVGPVTLAACGEGSLGEEFLIGLTSAAGYSIQDGKLMIDLMADGGRMIFGAAK
jgi:heat shock protein HslJ